MVFGDLYDAYSSPIIQCRSKQKGVVIAVGQAWECSIVNKAKEKLNTNIIVDAMTIVYYIHGNVSGRVVVEPSLVLSVTKKGVCWTMYGTQR
jgi:hypothetical protein